MMSDVFLETCWAIKKHWNNKFYYTVASCWLFLYDLYYDERIHEHQVSRHFLRIGTSCLSISDQLPLYPRYESFRNVVTFAGWEIGPCIISKCIKQSKILCISNTLWDSSPPQQRWNKVRTSVWLGTWKPF